MTRSAATAVKILAAAAAVGVFFFLDLTPPAPAEKPPNFVYIISDDHAWTDYGFMGHEVIQTPHLDRLAAESLVFTRGYVPSSLCRPSLATMMTGLYPHQHGTTGNDPDGEMRDQANRDRMVKVFRSSPAVSDILAKAGYTSHQSGKWWEGQCKCCFDECMTHGDVSRGGRHGDEGLKIGRETMQPVYDFLDSAGDKPFFLWYAPFLPHTPHDPPDRLLSKYLVDGRPEAVAKYYAMVEWFDETVGQVLDALDQRGLTDNTMVLFVSDNGWVQSEDPADWYQTRSKVSPYDAGLRTPIMVRWPGKAQPRRDERTLVNSVDLVPTILAAAKLDSPEPLPGLNLLEAAALKGRDRTYGALFAHTAVDVNDPVANLKYRWMVREDGWKLIEPYRPNAGVEMMIRPWDVSWMKLEPELFNVVDDPGEERDLAAERPDLVEQLAKDLQEWWRVPLE